MSKFRNPPFFSKFLMMNLVAKTFGLLGKVPSFFEFMGKSFKDEGENSVYEGFEPTERDIFAAVYSKSGTNLLLQTLQQTICRGEAEFDHIYSLVAWPESPFPTASLQKFIPPANAHNEMRIIKTPAKVSAIPFNEKAYYITVLRDPKDTVVSGYYFLPGIFGLLDNISPEEWLNLFFSPNYPAGSWAAHTVSWWELRDKSNVLVFFFDEMKNDPEGCLKKICDMIGIDLSKEEKEKVLHKSSFAYMKEKEDSFGAPIFPLMRNAKPPQMIRKGKSNSSGELLTREQQASIDAFVLKELEELGSDFPYREVFTVIE